MALGLGDSSVLKLRLAQIDAQLGDARAALDEINKANAGPAAEQLAVLTLKNAGRPDLARTRLDAARAKYPDSAELVGLDAALRLEANQPAEAEKQLSAFLKTNPDNLELSLLKAKILAGGLKQIDAARALLSQLSEQSETSQPLVQLALLEMSERNYPGVEKAIRQIRNRWKDAAAADLLDAQLSFSRGNPKAANEFLDSALKKDPSNKVALFWKAQLDDLTGSGADAQRIFEQLVRDRPVKELDAGLPLAVAAEWSLASRALDKQDYEQAITRFQTLLSDSEAVELSRSIRWKLATAYAAQGQSKEARHEVDLLLADPKVTPDERVRAADVYRNQGDEASANAQLDLVLKANPGHPGAVAYRSLMLTSKGQTESAVRLIRSALDSKQTEPPTIYLMLAAVENLGDAKAKTRAIQALDEGLKVYPDSIELLQARYALMTEAKDPKAVEFVEARAKASPNGPARTLLVDIYAERGELAKAKEILRGLIDETPKSSPAAASMLSRMAGFVAAQAADATRKGDAKDESVYLREAANLITDGRERFPDDLRFPRLECELAARSGDLARAKRLAQEMADTYPSSPVGLVLLGGLHAAENQPREAARAFEQALGRNPSDVSVRLDLARVLLSMNDAEDAASQAEAVLKTNPDLPAAVMIKAKALAMIPGKPEQVSDNREKALALLLALIQKNPKLVDAAHLASDIQVLQGRRAEGILTLEAALKADPRDDSGLSLLVQRLVEPSANSSANVTRARQLAESFGGSDDRGNFCLALAVGFQKGNRADLAQPWAEKASAKIDRPIVHLTYGDILLAQGEATSEVSTARDLFQNAIREYDKVLKAQPDSVEAINNKAWVLYRHLNRNDEALELAEGLTRQKPESELPPEFLDTLARSRPPWATTTTPSGASGRAWPSRPSTRSSTSTSAACSPARPTGPTRQSSISRRPGPSRTACPSRWPLRSTTSWPAWRPDLPGKSTAASRKGELAPMAQGAFPPSRLPLHPPQSGSPGTPLVPRQSSTECASLKHVPRFAPRRPGENSLPYRGPSRFPSHDTGTTHALRLARGTGRRHPLRRWIDQRQRRRRATPDRPDRDDEGQYHRRTEPEKAPITVDELPQVRRCRLLRQPDLPPRHPRLHDPGRRHDPEDAGEEQRSTADQE